MAERVVIVGAGHAGTNAASALREHGWAGEIVLLTAEEAAPYERPPLSKTILTGGKRFEEILLHPPGGLAANGIQFRRGVRVNSINPAAATIATSDGFSHSYDFLILATGSNAFVPEIPGVGLEGVVTLRSMQHSDVLRQRLRPRKKLVVIGGGLVGLEVAAAARSLSVETSVIEKAPALLSRVMPVSISSRILDLHREHGTQIALEAEIEAILGTETVEGVRLTSGKVFAADTVLVAVGAVPDVELAQAAGLAVDRGILVNKYLQTSDHRIYAAGDVARFPSGDGTLRLESWKNALDQGATVAANILGGQSPYRTVPWMWSDQFEKVVQVAGIPNASQIAVDRPLEDGGLMSFLLSSTGALEAVAAFGDISQVAKSIRIATSMIEKGVSPPAALLADPSSDLREILRSDTGLRNLSYGTKITAAI
ncbi:FAD-dependent oxidoreductase [Mesorhizobium sp. M1156]|uniref:NAD(P)/FAD-dependent oxidoreductase n=1 Tax=Mesorhizobium sp. M1156 TaxID=2957064 RepID=UPI0033383EF3